MSRSFPCNCPNYTAFSPVAHGLLEVRGGFNAKLFVRGGDMSATEKADPGSAARRGSATHAKASSARANAHAAHPRAKTVDE